MKKVIYTLILTTAVLNAWAIQTHRAVDRTAYEKADNLDTFFCFHLSVGVTYFNTQ